MTTFQEALTGGPVDTARALAVFDGLAPVDVDFMIGTWRGEEFPTGHEMDGLLGVSGWYGKRFDGPDAVHPLLFHTADRAAVFPVDPARVPLSLAKRVPTGAPVPYRRLLAAGRPLLRTSRPTARLRMTGFRGASTATMIYDTKPINDVFRRVDDDTVLGVMDCRFFADPYFFVLRRDAAPPPLR
jgi:hypothetical protein